MGIASQRRLQLGILLGPVSLFLLVFFAVPLGIMVVTSVLAPGLYGGVEWMWYPHNYGRILGFADPAFEEFDPVYIAIFLRSLDSHCASCFCHGMPTERLVRMASRRCRLDRPVARAMQ